MTRNRPEMRRLVLRLLIEHLEANYDLEFPFEESFRYNLSAHQIEALIAFKSDDRLDALRRALARLDEGTFGQCTACGHDIEDHLLHEEPSRSMCGRCEEKLRAVRHAQQPWIPTAIR
jgi:RNA polymerase-binding transcription factor DksA